jgi:hypothetical protein
VAAGSPALLPWRIDLIAMLRASITSGSGGLLPLGLGGEKGGESSLTVRRRLGGGGV